MRVGPLDERLLVFPSTDATGQCGGKGEGKKKSDGRQQIWEDFSPIYWKRQTSGRMTLWHAREKRRDWTITNSQPQAREKMD